MMATQKVASFSLDGTKLAVVFLSPSEIAQADAFAEQKAAVAKAMGDPDRVKYERESAEEARKRAEDEVLFWSSDPLLKKASGG